MNLRGIICDFVFIYLHLSNLGLCVGLKEKHERSWQHRPLIKIFTVLYLHIYQLLREVLQPAVPERGGGVTGVPERWRWVSGGDSGPVSDLTSLFPSRTVQWQHCHGTPGGHCPRRHCWPNSTSRGWQSNPLCVHRGVWCGLRDRYKNDWSDLQSQIVRSNKQFDSSSK